MYVSFYDNNVCQKCTFNAGLTSHDLKLATHCNCPPPPGSRSRYDIVYYVTLCDSVCYDSKNRRPSLHLDMLKIAGV